MQRSLLAVIDVYNEVSNDQLFINEVFNYWLFGMKYLILLADAKEVFNDWVLGNEVTND